MACGSPYDEMMSLKLDGLLGIEDERTLQSHISDCTECSLLWAAMAEADSLLLATVEAPVKVPAHFQVSLMLKIAEMPVLRPQPVGEMLPVLEPALGPVIPALHVEQPFPAFSVESLQEWQRRLSHYLRGLAVAGLAVAGTVGLMIALMLGNLVKVDGPFAGSIAMMRTFFGAVGTWVGSVSAGVGTGAVAAVLMIMGLLALAGWQMITTYHRTTVLEHGNLVLVEALG